jgi:putative addiction module component (TIGR02574 family)
MATKSEIILNEALTMSPDVRARMAKCLIQSLESPSIESVDEEWIKLAEKRFLELENGTVKPVSWEEIKRSICHV